MGRPREFCTQKALEAAMDVFWDKGYEAASLADLTKAMGISKSSFYDTYGSKHELLITAIRHYVDTTVKSGIEFLDSHDLSAIDTISAFFGKIVEKCCNTTENKGCMLSNCAVELSAHDAEAARVITLGMSRIEDGFYRAVRRGQEGGEIPMEKDARAIARFLWTVMNGMMVVGRANPDESILQDVRQTALNALK